MAWVRSFGELSDRARLWLRRKRDYDAVFKTPGGQITDAATAVFRDLGQFCGAYSTTAKVSPVQREVDVHAMLIAEGRRQVWLHIQRRLRLTDEQILGMMEDAHD